MSNDEKFESISVPASIVAKLQEKIKGTRFTSVSEYVTSILHGIIEDSAEPRTEEVFSKEDEEAVDKRLRALGYVD